MAILKYDTCDVCDEKRPDIVIKEEESRLRICPDCYENYPIKENDEDKYN